MQEYEGGPGASYGNVEFNLGGHGDAAVLGSLAASGDLEVVLVQRLAAIAAAEHLGDPELTARVIGGFDVPGIWTRSDDPAAAAAVVAAAERALTFPSRQLSVRTRARLLGTIAMETR